MAALTLEFLAEQLEVADRLRTGRESMFEPQDLPGRYGRVVAAVDRVLAALNCPALLAGGWAVWRHGYLGRVTQDLDVVLPADRLEDFLRTAAVAGFEALTVQPGNRPKMLHRDTGTQVDLLPEGGRPGTFTNPAPTTIPHPQHMGAEVGKLRYLGLPYLIELKLAAGRARDEADIIELVRANPQEVESVRSHLAGVHRDYLAAFDRMVARAEEQRDA